VILALMLIMALSFTVWGHHMYTTGLVNDSFFSVTTELISVPTGVLVLCWLFTLWKGKLSFEPPMLFALGFIAMFVIGGIDGVWMASPAADFTIHDTYFVVSHIHYVPARREPVRDLRRDVLLVPQDAPAGCSAGGSVSGSFWLLLISFNVTFFPMHFLGLWGCRAGWRRIRSPPVGADELHRDDLRVRDRAVDAHRAR
jgi:cytochrome c oxidase subunit 1